MSTTTQENKKATYNNVVVRHVTPKKSTPDKQWRITKSDECDDLAMDFGTLTLKNVEFEDAYKHNILSCEIVAVATEAETEVPESNENLRRLRYEYGQFRDSESRALVPSCDTLVLHKDGRMFYA